MRSEPPNIVVLRATQNIPPTRSEQPLQPETKKRKHSDRDYSIPDTRTKFPVNPPRSAANVTSNNATNNTTKNTYPRNNNNYNHDDKRARGNPRSQSPARSFTPSQQHHQQKQHQQRSPTCRTRSSRSRSRPRTRPRSHSPRRTQVPAQHVPPPRSRSRSRSPPHILPPAHDQHANVPCVVRPEHPQTVPPPLFPQVLNQGETVYPAYHAATNVLMYADNAHTADRMTGFMDNLSTRERFKLYDMVNRSPVVVYAGVLQPAVSPNSVVMDIGKFI